MKNIFRSKSFKTKDTEKRQEKILTNQKTKRVRRKTISDETPLYDAFFSRHQGAENAAFSSPDLATLPPQCCHLPTATPGNIATANYNSVVLRNKDPNKTKPERNSLYDDRGNDVPEHTVLENVPTSIQLRNTQQKSYLGDSYLRRSRSCDDNLHLKELPHNSLYLKQQMKHKDSIDSLALDTDSDVDSPNPQDKCKTFQMSVTCPDDTNNTLIKYPSMDNLMQTLERKNFKASTQSDQTLNVENDVEVRIRTKSRPTSFRKSVKNLFRSSKKQDMRKSQSNPDINELLKNCSHNEDRPSGNLCPSFPNSEGVEVRHSHDRAPRPRTFQSSQRTGEEEIFIKENEVFRFKDNSLTIKNMKYTLKDIERFVEETSKTFCIDTFGKKYRICFDSEKQARQFKSEFERNTNVEKTTGILTKFFKKRVSKEILENKGIFRNEAVYGNSLEVLYMVYNDIPEFIYEIIRLIELPENIKSQGLYRTPGNLATMQKIRLEIDKNNLAILRQYEKDVDVLAGALKLFFREMKEPLLLEGIVDKILRILKKNNLADREALRPILGELPAAHKQALYVLITHLLTILDYKSENKMDAYNLSVCWGQTVIFYSDSKDLLQKSSEAVSVLEFILNYYNEHRDALKYLQQNVKKTEPTKIQRHDSKDSIGSNDKKKDKEDQICCMLSNLLVEVHKHIKENGLYFKNGSTTKVEKIVKRMKKFKLEKVRGENIHDITDALKRYLKEMKIINKSVCKDYYEICEREEKDILETILPKIEKRRTLDLILKHIAEVCKEKKSPEDKEKLLDSMSKILCEQNVSKSDISGPRDLKNLIKVLLSKYQVPEQPDLIKGLESNPNYLRQKEERERQKSMYDNLDYETKL
ncbi:unnamed protein product [Brassicogethes aeneus]|uniref:Rho-GAP domain-containing protein n=1 Tax=Brassicogethes aeneus TaxID=1431903 RepID=A0A9P0FEB5_BRAAE|nr:unnamed protein product [Brassicogethes aeneus]